MRVLFNLLIILFTVNVYAAQLIIEPDMGRKPVIEAIQTAQHSLHLVMYGFTDKTLLNAILNNHQSIQIILQATPYKTTNQNKSIIAALNEHHIIWHATIPPLKFIHQKTLLIDGNKAIVMTFNFTRATFNKERNFGLVIDDPREVQQIETMFAKDWKHQPTTNTDPNLIYSPDNSRKEILHLIHQTNYDLKIYAQSLNDYEIVGALAKIAKQNVSVAVLTSTPLQKRISKYLQNAGVQIHYNKKYLIHAKVLIIDDRLALIGSINFTKASLDNNRELGVITREPLVVNQLLAVFKQDWKG